MPHSSDGVARSAHGIDRLDSWKEIAAHLNRSISTVQRWEREEGLPVRRLRHAKLGSVYAFRSELDRWWESRGSVLDGTQDSAESRAPEAEDPVTSGRTGGAREPALRWPGRRGLWLMVVPTLLAAAVVGVSFAPALRTRSIAAQPISSVAVLPLKDIGAANGDDWFAEGVTDAIRAAVARHTRAKVSAATSSAFVAFAGKSKGEVARALGVDALVEGTVERRNGRQRVSVTVIDGRTSRSRAEVSAEREVRNSFELYDEVARQVAASLESPVVPAPSAVETVNPAAYEAYLRGMYFRKRRQAGGCRLAEAYLTKALKLDPGLAAAHAELAFCYGFDHLSGQLTADEAARRGREEAARALALDEQEAQAHVALGLIQHRHDYDWMSAERSFRRALEIQRDHADARIFLAELQHAAGRGEEALVNFRLALALDPFHLDHNTGVGFAFYTMRKFDLAVDQLRKTLELDPSWLLARFWLAESLAGKGARDEAVAEYLNLLQPALVPARSGPETKRLAAIYRREGWRAFWKGELVLAEEDARQRGSVWQIASRTAPYFMARRYARLGENDRALAALHAAYRDRAYMLIFVAVDPVLAPLHPDPQFLGLLQRVRLSPPTTGGPDRVASSAFERSKDRPPRRFTRVNE